MLVSVFGVFLWLDDCHECAAVHRSEQRVEFVFKVTGEGEDVRLGFRIVEGDLAFLVV